MLKELLWFCKSTGLCYSLKGLPKWVLPELEYLLARIETLEKEVEELKNA